MCPDDSTVSMMNLSVNPCIIAVIVMNIITRDRHARDAHERLPHVGQEIADGNEPAHGQVGIRQQAVGGSVN